MSKKNKDNQMLSIDAGMLDDVVNNFKIVRGALGALTGTFDADVGDDDYWGKVGMLNAIEVVINDQGKMLQKSIEELCRLAGRSVYPENTTETDKA